MDFNLTSWHVKSNGYSVINQGRDLLSMFRLSWKVRVNCTKQVKCKKKMLQKELQNELFT